MFENDELKSTAWKKTGLLMTNSIPDKDVCALAEYIMQLSQKETEIYVNIAQMWYDRKTIFKSGRIKITPNAVSTAIIVADISTPYGKFHILNIVAIHVANAGNTY